MCQGVIEQYDELVRVLVLRKNEPDSKLVNLGEECLFMFRYDNLVDFFQEYMEEAGFLAFGIKTVNSIMPAVTTIERQKIYTKEKYEREMILNDLKFETHINIDKFQEPISSRRFITSNSSCLSLFQVTVSDKLYRWVIVSRSTEVNKMLPSDLYSIGRIIEDWTSWFIGYADLIDDHRGIKIALLMNNPHYYME